MSGSLTDVAGPREPYRPPGGSLLYLSRDDLESLGVTMLEVVDAVDARLRRQGQGRGGHAAQAQPARRGRRVLPGHGGDAAGRRRPGRQVGHALSRRTPPRGLPITNGLVVLSDPRDGAAVGRDGRRRRSPPGAPARASASPPRYLARPDVACVGVLGCGVQARAAVRALAAVLPELRTVRCHDAVRGRRRRRSSAELGAELAGRRAHAVPRRRPTWSRGAGVVVTAITMTADIRPPLGPGLLEPGALAVALDYDAAWSPAAMAECDRFFCDDTATVRATQAAGTRLAGIPGGDRRGSRRAGRRPRRRPRRRRTSACSASTSAWRSRTS